MAGNVTYLENGSDRSHRPGRGAAEMGKGHGPLNQMRLVPAVFRMVTGYWASQTIYVAAKLGIADVLGEGSKSGDEIASATGANGNSLVRLTQALVSLGVLAVDDDGRFRLTGT